MLTKNKKISCMSTRGIPPITGEGEREGGTPSNALILSLVLSGRGGYPVLSSGYPVQWRIQNFPHGGGGNPKGGRENLLFGQIFNENCMKMK